MTRHEVRDVRARIQQALLDIGDELGFEISLGSASFDNRGCTFKMELSKVFEDGTVLTRAAMDFNACCHLYGLKPEHLGQTFVVRGTEYRLTGAKPLSPKFPLLAENLNTGKTFKFTAPGVQQGLKTAGAV